MNLVEDNISGKKSNKKIFMACGIGIVVLLLIVIILAICATVLNSGMKLVIDSKKAKASYLWKDGDAYYVQVEVLATNTSNGYSYKTGNPDIPDSDGCYLTNPYETTVFKVNSNQIYKITRMEDDSQEIAYYDMDNPAKLRDTDNKIYIPVSAVKIAANAECTVTDKQITIQSIGYTQAFYDREVKAKVNNFVKDESIKWDVSYSNKKLLKDNLVVIRDNDNSNLYGVAKLGYNTSGKGKKQKIVVTHTEILSPRYKSIEYNEKFNQLVVETDDGKGIIQLVRDGENIRAKTVVTPQYEDIKPINKDLYLIAEKRMIESTRIDSNTGEKKQEYIIKYGIINSNQEQVLPTEYDYIGVENAYQYTNNSMKDEFIILDKYIPVKRDDLWGLVDLDGKIILKPTYDSLGCAETNASSNVFIIPEINAFVFKRNSKYGISYFTGEVIIKNAATRIYIDTTKEEKKYNMIWKDKTYDVLQVIEENQYMTSITDKKDKEIVEDPNSSNTTNTTNTANNTTNNTTNNTVNNTTNNTTKTTNSTNATNRTNAVNTTNNTTNKTTNNQVVIVNPTV